MQQGGGSYPQQFTFSGGGGDQAEQKQQMVVEEASPISSRPPATDEFGLTTMDALARAAAHGDDPDRGGGRSAGGNRWPRQETVALLKIRSEMDNAFRDATVKGPLWEDVSRKMAELGYRRNAKKCREKFENVDKYYKRTKEGRGGRQDGKSYKFYTELEALHNTSTSTAAPPPFTVAVPPPLSNVVGIDFSSPMPISSVRSQTPHVSAAVAPPSSSPVGLDFSSNSSSSCPETEDDDLDNEGTDLDGEPLNTAGSSRKRRRGRSRGRSRRMMEFFQGLMKQVMQKQEAIQQKFLEDIERREQERIMREESWKRQEMAKLAQEHEIMARERAVAASRDASILSFLQKVTGQLPIPPVVATAAVVSPPTPIPAPPVTSQPITPQSYQQPHYRQLETALAAVPEQQVRIHDDRSEPPSSSRWPKTEVLALIRVRSGLEPRYHEAGPKGPLWEEVSATMRRMGYNRNPKRCKEKWENINKYFKKVKESNKQRPEDAKTCPYFHELDTLYRNKVLGSGSGSGSGSEGGIQLRIEAPVIGGSQEVQHPPNPEITAVEAKEGGDAGAKQPEDTVKVRWLDLHDDVSVAHPVQQFNISELRNENSTVGGSSNADEEDEAMEDYDDDDDEDEDDNEHLQEERKLGYKIEFQQRHNAAGPPNGGGNGAATSYLAMVQ